MKFISAIILLTLLSSLAYPFDRNDVPLRDWDGFGGNQYWVYEALEKIVLAGLADQVILNTKPLNRVEAARIVAQAVNRLREDQYGDYNHRGYLEEIVYRLVRELGPNLHDLGVETSFNRDKPTGFIRLKPITHAQATTDFSTGTASPPNESGRQIYKGANLHTIMSGRGQVGDFLSFYYQPQFSRTADATQFNLINGYAKATYKNVEVLGGREAIWWGSGYRGSMSFSGNAFPLDQIRVGSAEPFRLPWILKHLGPMKLNLMVSRLGKDRAVPHAKLAAWRIQLAPFKYFEMGFTRAFQFGGDNRPGLSFGQFMGLLFGQGSDDPSAANNANNVLSLDFTIRWPDAGRYLFIMRDMSLYGELGWDDTQDPGFTLGPIPTGSIIPRKPGGLIGTFMTGFLGDPYLDFRFEYAKTSEIQFINQVYQSGWTHNGQTLSHFIGRDGWEFFTRLTRSMTPDLKLGGQVSIARVGNTDLTSANQARMDRKAFAVDMSYRMAKTSTLFMGFEFADLDNAGFKSGKSARDITVRIQFTRSFEDF